MKGSEILSAFEDFLIKMSKLPESRAPKTSDACKKICEFLRIGKADVILYESSDKEGTDQFGYFVLYDSGVSEAEPSVLIRKTSPVGHVPIYRFYRSDNTYEWSDEERREINILASMLFVFHGRLRLIEINDAMTFYDADMSIYNLKYFMRHIGSMIGKNDILGYDAIFFNLRRFSVVNAQIGRVNGSEVMKNYIEELNKLLTDNEMVCRIGGDNFAMIVKDKKLDSVIDIFKGKSIDYGKESWEHIVISASAGIYRLDGVIPAYSPAEIMDRMSVASAHAKAMKSGWIAFYDSEMMENHEKTLKISAEFHKALEKGEFLVYYQPKVSAGDMTIVGAEALSRWRHDGRIIYPGDFINILERDMNICRLDFYVLDKVCKDISRWLKEGKNTVKVSVNLSRRHLADPQLLQHILDIIDNNNIPHNYIEIEVTETTTDVEFKRLKNFIKGLQAEGISTSVDDFGVGYSSLTLIKDIPWDVLKIDRGFLSETYDQQDQKKQIMLKHVVAMAKELGLECLAEGVETRQQLEMLRSLCCDTIQGYFFDKPLPVDEFEERLDRGMYHIDEQ